MRTLAAVFLLFPALHWAGTIDITIGGSVSGGITSIEINGGTTFANKTANVYSKSTGDGGKGLGNISLDGAGKGSESVAGVTTDEVGVVIGGESWGNITESGTYRSKEEKEQSNNSSVKVKGFDVLPFDGLDSFFPDSHGNLFDELTVENSSASGYDVSSLKLYMGLNPSFFTQSLFDSAAALASGVLVKDLIANLGEDTEIPATGDPFLLPDLTVSNPVTLPGYLLLIGQARQELPGGGLGPSMSFSIASLEIPEPDSLTLLVDGLILLGGLAASRRTRSSAR
jgi:hypothetical protein